MFSRRTSWDRTPNRFARALAGRRALGRRILDLTDANPTTAGLGWDPEELAAAYASPRNAAYDPDPRGLLMAREAIARELAARASRDGEPASAIPATRLFLTASTSEAYSFLFRLLCDPGDTVMVPQPCYPLFEHLAGLDSVEISPYRLRLDSRWRLRVESLADSLTERARAVIVVAPHVPVGAFLAAAEAAELAALCAERQLALISDEVFADHLWPGQSLPGPRSLAAVAPGAGCLAFTLSGLSKSCGLPQAKLGWIGLSGPDALVEEAAGRLEIVADAYLSASTAVQNAVPLLLPAGARFRERVARRLAEHRSALETAVASTSGRVLPAEAGWYSVVELPRPGSEVETCLRLLDEDGVVVHPGHFFDLAGDHVIVSLLTEGAVFEEGLLRLASRLG